MARLGIASPLLAATLLAGNAWSQAAGTVDFWAGAVAISSKAGEKQIPFNGLGLNPGDLIQTGADGELHVVLADGGFLAVRPNTVVRIVAFSAKGEAADETWIDLVHGALRSVTGWIGKTRPAAHKVTTPIGIIGVRGTDFDVLHDSAGTHNWVREGATILRTPKGELEVRSGEAASVRDAADTPRLHDGIPQFIHERQGKFERRIDEYAQRIDEHIGRALRERGLSPRPDAKERRGGEAKPEKPEKTERANDQARPERTEARPEARREQERPERSERNRRK